MAPSAEEAVAGADITFVMLADPAAALAVAKQAAKGLSKGELPACTGCEVSDLLSRLLLSRCTCTWA